MRPTDSKITDLLPRIVERPARRSDEKDEEPWSKPASKAGDGAGRAVRGVPLRATLFLLPLLLFFSLMGFLLTAVPSTDTFLAPEKVADASRPSGAVLRRRGAPLVHSEELANCPSPQRQFFGGALALNGLFWLAMGLAWWCCIHVGIAPLLTGAAGRYRQFTLGHILALTVWVAMTLGAWRADSLAAPATPPKIADAFRTFEDERAIGPFYQSISRLNIPAAAFAYLGTGCLGASAVLLSLRLIHQFLPPRPGEDKSLLQQIF